MTTNHHTAISVGAAAAAATINSPLGQLDAAITDIIDGIAFTGAISGPSAAFAGTVSAGTLSGALSGTTAELSDTLTGVDADFSGTVTATSFSGSIIGTAQLSGTLVGAHAIFSGQVSADSYIGDGSGLTGIGTGTGGVINTGSTTIGADSDDDDVGEIAFQVKGATIMTVENDGQVNITKGWTGTKASNDYQLLIRNTNEDASGPDDYQNEVHLRLQAGSSANHRRYIDWHTYDGNQDWLMGVNASQNFILFDNDVHRLQMQKEVADERTYLTSGSTYAVYINYHPGDTTAGRGGLQIWSGGTRTKAHLTTHVYSDFDADPTKDWPTDAYLDLNSGVTAAVTGQTPLIKSSRIRFRDRSTGSPVTKWQLSKLTDNSLSFYDNTNAVYPLWFNTTKHVGIFNTTPTASLDVLLMDAETATVQTVTHLGHDSSGLPTDGFGGRLLLKLESGGQNTTPKQNAASLRWIWNAADHNTRKADLVLSAYDTVEREGLRIRGAGSAVALSFFGVTPAAQQATVADAKVDYTTGDLDTEAEVIAAFNTTNGKINSILATLETFGFHAT